MSPTSGNTETASPTDSGDTWEKLHGRPVTQSVGWMVPAAMAVMIGAGAVLMSIAPPQPPQPRPAPTAAAPPPLDPLAPREYSEAENRAAFEKYMAPIRAQQEEARQLALQRVLDDSSWICSISPKIVTTLQFTAGKTATIAHRFHPIPQVDRLTTYAAECARNGERLRLQFEDGSMLDAKLSLRREDRLSFSEIVVEGSGAATAVAEFVKIGFTRTK